MSNRTSSCWTTSSSPAEPAASRAPSARGAWRPLLRGRLVHALAAAALLATAVALPTGAHASVVTQYDFSGTSLAASTLAPGSSATAVNFGGSSASQFALSNILAVSASSGATTAATAIASNSYFQFTVTPDAGLELDLTSLTFKAAYGSTGSGFAVRSSVDGFATDLLAAVIATAAFTYTDYTASFAVPAFQDLTAATTFRIYVYHGAGGGPAAAFDDLTLNGAVSPASPPSAALPTPATPLLVLAGLGAAFATRRRAPQQPMQGDH